MDKTKTIQISDIGEVITGNTPPRKNPEYYGDYMLFIKPTDISKDSKYTYNPEECYSEIGYEKYKKTLIPQGATCVVTIGSIGEKLTKAHTDCFINQAMNAVIPNEKYDEDYVYYVLKYNLKQLKMFDSGTASGRENVSKSAFSSININILTKKDNQIKVGKILSNYDDLIENNNKRIKILEEMAQKIYKEWFVDFKFPNHETATFKQTDLGSEVMPIKGKNITKAIIKKGNVPVVAGGIEPAYYHNIPNTVAPVITVSASGANAGYINLYYQDIWASDCSYIDTTMTPYVYYYYLLLKYNQIKVTNMQRGAAQPHVYPKDLAQLKIKIPEENVIREFNEIITPFFSEISNFSLKNQTLKQTRDLLLPRLISGEIDIENLEVI